MERYTMFLDWKNQYCENDYTIQSTILAIYRFSAIPYQTINGIFHRIINKAKNATICMETQKIPSTKAILRKKKELEESTFQTSDYTTKLQSSRQYHTGTEIEI